MTAASMVDTDNIRGRVFALVDRLLGQPEIRARIHQTRILEQARARLAEARYHVVVCGEYCVGKSTLLNELVGLRIFHEGESMLPTTNTVCTLRWGETQETMIEYIAPDGSRTRSTRGRVDADTVREVATELGNPNNERQIQLVEMRAPIERLRSGTVLVDTPGIGGVDASHTLATHLFLPWADAIVFVLNAADGVSKANREFLINAYELCPVVLTIVSKVENVGGDIALVLGDVRLAVADATGRAPDTVNLVGVSSYRKRRADAEGNPALLAESGFPQLTAALGDGLTDTIGAVRARAALQVVGDVLAAAHTPLIHAITALDDDDEGADLAARLREEQTRARRYRALADRLPDRIPAELADIVAPHRRWLDRSLRDGQQRLVTAISNATADADDAVRLAVAEMTRHVDEATTRVEEAAADLSRRYARDRGVSVLASTRAPMPYRPAPVVRNPPPDAPEIGFVARLRGGLDRANRMAQLGWTVGGSAPALSAGAVGALPLIASGIGAAIGAVIGLAIGAQAYAVALRRRQERRWLEETALKMTVLLDEIHAGGLLYLDRTVQYLAQELRAWLDDQLTTELESLETSIEALTADRDRDAQAKARRRDELIAAVTGYDALWTELGELASLVGSPPRRPC